MDTDEILQLVDDNDQVIGTIPRGDVRNLTAYGGKYIRTVNAFIVRSDGKIWVPVRSIHKKIAPGGLDYSVGAHVQAGESYIDSLVREFQEEAGIAIDESQCIEIAYDKPSAFGTDTIYFDKLYLVKTDKQPLLSDEHTSGSFMNITEAIDKTREGMPVKDHYLQYLIIAQEYLGEK